MARKAKRDLTMEEQLARGPMDLPFLMLTMMLVGIGLIMVFSASYASAYYDSSALVRNNPLFYIKRQAMFAVAGTVIMYVVSKMNYQTFRILSIPLLLGSIVLLVLVLTPLGVNINNAQRWLKMFLVFGPTYQPSEIAKVAVIIFFAARLSKRDTEKKRKFTNRTLTGRTLNRLERVGFLELVPYGVVLGTVLILVVLEPHMSGTILILVGAAAVLFAAGINLGWFIGIGGSAVAALSFIIINTSYMTSRIKLWLDPGRTPGEKAIRRFSLCWPSAPAACWAWGWARAARSCCTSRSRRTTSFFPLWWRSWALWAERSCCCSSRCSSCGATGWPSTPGISLER